MQRGKVTKYFLIGPTLLIVFAVSLYPMLFAFVTSFRDWRLARSLTPEEFVGFENYTRALLDDNFLNSFWVTMRYVVISVSLSIILGLLFAVILQKRTALTAVAKVVLVLPFAVAPALRGLTWRFMLNPQYGAYDKLIDTLFPFMSDIQWLSEPLWALLMMATTEVWGWSSLVGLMFLGALGTINPEVTEAAALDGANEWQTFWRVTIPMIAPIILLVTLLRIIFSLKVFDQVVTLTGGGPGNSTETLNYFVYKAGFRFFDFGYASAIGYILVAILFVAAFFYVRMLLGGEQDA